MLFGLLAPIFWPYSVYALWFTCSQILAMFCLCSLVYFLPYFSYILFMLFGLLAPRHKLYSVYVLSFTCSQIWLYSIYILWFTCSKTLTIFCLCSLVYLFLDINYVLFLLFGLLVPIFSLYSVYALWFTCSQILALFCLCSLDYLLPDFGIFCLCSLVYLFPDFSYLLFMLFGLLPPRF
jgi:hypothetical protein